MTSAAPETSGSAPAGTEPADPSSRLRDRLEPAHLFMLAAAVALLVLTVGPITDIDTYWHVLIGQEIQRTGRIGGLGNDWSLYLPGQGWETSQWGAEVVMAKVQALGGWGAFIWLRTALVAVLLASLCRTLLRRSTPLASTVVLVVVMLPSAPVLEERPMLASLVLLVWLSAAAYDLLVDRRSPRWFVVLGVVALWANLHGMWVLAPAAFLLVAVALVLDRDASTRPRAIVALRMAGVAVVAGCLTPLGPKGLLLPFTFRSATSQIAEWQRVELTSSAALGLLTLVLLLVALWARRGRTVRWSLLVYVAVWFVFGMTAYRNLLPAGLMIAPIVAAQLGTTRLLRARPAAPHERQALAVVGLVMIVLSIATVGVLAARVEPLAKATPLAIAEKLATLPGEKRVLNGYNASGVLVAFGGSDVRLAIDGRSDRFGGDYIDRYNKAIDLQGPWQEVLDDVRPTYAVISTESALAYELTTHRGWTTVMTDGDYSLLTPAEARVPATR